MQDFDMNYDFLKRIFYENEILGPDDVQEIPAKIWLKEIFLSVQANAPRLNVILIFPIIFILANTIFW